MPRRRPCGRRRPTTTSRRRSRAVEHHAEEQFGEERDRAGDDHRDHHHAHVAVADMGQLVGEHGLDLGVVEPLASGRDVTVIEYCFSFRPVAKALSASSSMTLQLRHRNAARDAEIFQQIVEPRLLLARHLVAAGHRVDHRLVEAVGDQDPDDGADGGERAGLDQIAPGARAAITSSGALPRAAPRPAARRHRPSDRPGRTARSAARSSGAGSTGCGCRARRPPCFTQPALRLAAPPRSQTLARQNLTCGACSSCGARLAEIEECRAR